MKQIQEHLNLLYGEKAACGLVDDILGLCEKYRINFQDKKIEELSEKDALLIVYGDQILGEGGESKLRTLHQLLKQQINESINHVHILPFYPYSSDDGFSVIDYYAVNPDLGNWQAIEDFSKDFNLMFDGVINHMSSQSEWFQGYLDDDPQFKEFFVDGESFTQVDGVVRPRVSPLIHTYRNEKKVWTTFSEDQVDLNYKNPQVLLQVIDLMLFYISHGASLIRLDAVGFIWKIDGTSCIHLDETHAIIKLIRKVLEKCVPGVKLITETNVPHLENVSYFGNGDEAHMVYNFTLPPLLAFSIINGETSKLVEWAQSLQLPAQNVCFFNFLASHDGVGVRPVTGILNSEEIQTLLDNATQAGGKISYKADANGSSPYEINCNYFDFISVGVDKSMARKRMLLAHAILLAFPGFPAIYFHSMFGLHNDIDGMEQKGYNRAINRQKFSKEEIEQKLDDKNGDSYFVLNSIQKIVSMRKKYPAFNPYASFSFPKMTNGLFAIVRTPANDNEQEITAYFNLTKQSLTVSVPVESKDLLSQEQLPAGNLQLDAFDFKFLT